MKSLSAFEDAANNITNLLNTNIVDKLKGANEAETRLLIIDEVLAILGWSKEEYCPERSTSTGGYTDYALSIDGEVRLIVEAKRIDYLIPFPKALKNSEYTNKYLISNCGEEIKLLLEQAKTYCFDQGVPYAVATTGDIWIILSAVFKPGVKWGELRSFVFHSLEDIKLRFLEFYGLLSREAVSSNSLEEKFLSLPTIVPKISILPRDEVESAIPIPNSGKKTYIEYFFQKFLDDIISNQDMLDSCYVTNRDLTEYSQELKQLIEHNIQLDDPNLDAKLVTEEVLENEIDLQVDMTRPKTILLVGNIGAGKTTFINNFIKQNSSKDDVSIILDFINQGNIIPDNNEKDRIIKSILDSFSEKFHDTLDPYDREILRSCFDKELGTFKNQRKALVEFSLVKYNLEEEKYLQQLSQASENRLRHLVGYISLTKKRKFRCCIAFDNVDRNSDQYQEFIYGFAHELSQKAKCITIITLREDTFTGAREAGFLDVRQADKIFRVKAPEFRQVLSRRRKYIDRLIEEPGNSKTFKGQKKFLAYLNRHMNSLLLKDNRSLRDAITMLSNNNLRESFRLLKGFYTSFHSGFYKNYDDYLNIHEGEPTDISPEIILDYDQEMNNFISALMLGDSWVYQANESDILNLFAVEAIERSSHFLMLRLLAYLSLKHKSSLSPAGLQYKQVLITFGSFGYKQSHVYNAFQRMLKNGLVISSDSLKNIAAVQDIEINDKTKLRLTPKGYYYLNQLHRQSYYLARVGEDTIWYNEDLARKYISCLQDSVKEQSKEELYDYLQLTDAKRIFLNYLEQEFTSETSAGGFRTNGEEWIHINELVGKLFSAGN